MNNGKWVSNKEACEFFGVTKITLTRWESRNKIKTKRTDGGHRRYFICEEMPEDIKKSSECKDSYIYVRVSSRKQQDDLRRQRDFLHSKYPDYKFIEDIGSGLNYKRKGLLRLLELSNKGKVKTIVVFSKDRLCRFGFELLQWQFLQNNTELVVYEQHDKSPEQEFTEDILAILQVFACRWNGKRKYKLDKNKEVEIEIKQFTEKSSK